MEYKWIALSNTTLGTLMSSLDGNIVIIAVPTIARDLRATPFEMLWVLLGYQLVTAVSLVNLGRLADILGRVKLYNLGFAIFTAGSALCSLSITGTELVAFRMIQGVGGALLFSNSAAILTDAFPPNERGMALGTNQVAIVAGSVTGLILGGVLTSLLGWRSIFWVNIPIGVFATLWSHFKLRELGRIKKGERIDVWGNMLFAAGLSSILTAITINAVSGLSLPIYASLLSLGFVALVGFGIVETRVEDPMFDFSLFRIRTFLAGNVAIFMNSLARGAFSLIMTLYLQGPTVGLSPLEAGLYLTPVSISLSILGPVSGRISDRYGSRYLASLGLGVSAVGFLMLSNIGYRTSFLNLLLPMVLAGAGMGIFASPNRASIMNSLPPERRGTGSGISSTLVNTGGILSLSTSFDIMGRKVPKADLASIFSGNVVSNAPWTADFISSIHEIFYLSTALLLIAVVPSLMRGSKEVELRDRESSVITVKQRRI
jgi:EmrB/QacA subfamily drug resistance transporter